MMYKLKYNGRDYTCRLQGPDKYFYKIPIYASFSDINNMKRYLDKEYNFKENEITIHKVEVTEVNDNQNPKT